MFIPGVPNIACYMTDVASMHQLRAVMTPFSEEVKTRGGGAGGGKQRRVQPIGPTEAENREGRAYLCCR